MDPWYKVVAPRKEVRARLLPGDPKTVGLGVL